jgi:hypothetical protein
MLNTYLYEQLRRERNQAMLDEAARERLLAHSSRPGSSLRRAIARCGALLVVLGAWMERVGGRPTIDASMSEVPTPTPAMDTDVRIARRVSIRDVPVEGYGTRGNKLRILLIEEEEVCTH